MTRPLAAEIRAHILRLRDELGISYFCIRGAHVDELAQVVRELTGPAVTPAIQNRRSSTTMRPGHRRR